MIGFSSCEMRDELWGKGEAGENAGTLELDLASIYNGVTMSRADEVVDGGTTTGNFDAEDVNVDNYTLIVTNAETQEEVARGKVSELKNESGKVVLPLSEGDYSVTAYNYEGENVTVSERPYFKGEQTFSVKKGIATSVDLPCKLACVEVSVGLTASFEESFKDDYSVIVDNGDGATQIFDKNSLGKKYYFQVPEHQNSLNASIKATSVEGNFIELKATIQKPSDAEGSESYLAGGDSFNIQLTEEGSTDSYISIGITVDLTFTEVGETIEIPVGNIIYEGRILRVKVVRAMMSRLLVLYLLQVSQKPTISVWLSLWNQVKCRLLRWIWLRKMELSRWSFQSKVIMMYFLCYLLVWIWISLSICVIWKIDLMLRRS